eukprot:6209809-Pleurochrysis_carterae.AAC.2
MLSSPCHACAREAAIRPRKRGKCEPSAAQRGERTLSEDARPRYLTYLSHGEDSTTPICQRNCDLFRMRGRLRSVKFVSMTTVSAKLRIRYAGTSG